MKKKTKRKTYTRKEIRESRKRGETKIIHELAVRLLQNEKMSIGEMEEAAAIVGNSRPEGSIEKVNLGSIPAAQDYIFKMLYLAYYRDLEGKHGIEKFSGQVGVLSRDVPMEEKKEDVIKLNEYYNAWKLKFSQNNHSDQILNLVINETKKDLKEIDQLLAQGKITHEEYNYKHKGTILRSKYIHMKVTAAFQEAGAQEVLIDFGGSILEITPWSMVHILNRHYAGPAMQYESGKSFHSDQTLKFFEDPNELKIILEELGRHPQLTGVPLKYIPFRLNKVLYAVYTEVQIKHVKGAAIPYNRVQTFYPIQEQLEVNKIMNDYNEVMISPILMGFVPK